MSNLFEWDELNLIREEARNIMALPRNERKKRLEQFCDYLEFVLCLVYAYGWKDAEEIVGIVPFEDGLDDKTVNLEIENKTFRDRVEEQFDDGDAYGLLRIIDTEAHRDYNTAIYEAGSASGTPNLRKKWVTRHDDLVRDTHSYMEGQTVGINDLFYTYTGASAMYPGGFGEPEEDCNCRCAIALVT
jgi:hypothetical protein